MRRYNSSLRKNEGLVSPKMSGDSGSGPENGKSNSEMYVRDNRDCPRALDRYNALSTVGGLRREPDVLSF